MTVHEDMARTALDDFMGDAEGARALQVYVQGIRDGRWSQEYRDVIHQHHWASHWPYEQVAAFALVHSDLMSGDVADVQLTTFGHAPSPDRERSANAAALADLPRPFIAEVDMGQNGGDADGRLRWVEPIRVEVSTGVPFTDPCGHTGPVPAIRTIPPGSVPLEIGTTMASNTLFHLRRDRGVARWPYGHDLIRLFVSVGENWQSGAGL